MKSTYTASDPKMNEEEVITEQEEYLEQPLQKKILFSPRKRKTSRAHVSKKTRKGRKYHYVNTLINFYIFFKNYQ